MSTQDQRSRMARAIIDFEARRDANGNLAVYKIPAGDGGGTYEVAGINDKYHKAQVDKLVSLINQKRFVEAEASVAAYVLSYTDVVSRWTDNPGVEFFLRDTAFNRGPTGAARILQRALRVTDDGEIGPVTRAALARIDPDDLIDELWAAREDYERDVAKRDETSKFWKGLSARWDKAVDIANKFNAESPAEKPAPARPPKEGWFSAFLRLILGLFRKAPPIPQSIGEPPWMAGARQDIGFHEVGTNRGIERFIASAKAGKIGDAYCAIWVNAKLEDVGIRGTRSAMARSFESSSYFVRLGGPAIGAIGTMWRGTPSAGTGHCFFYVGETPEGYLGLGANQDDGVNVKTQPRSRHTGWWWPKGYPLPKIGAVQSVITAVQSRTEI